jgi:hypothetical protein
MLLTPQFPRARASRTRHLATKVRGQASTPDGAPIATRLIEFAVKLEGDALRDEEEANILSTGQDATASHSLLG